MAVDVNGNGAISRAVKGEFALGIQRIFVIVGIPMMLGIGGWLTSRAVASFDDLSRQVSHQGIKMQEKLDAIQQTVGAQGSTVQVLQNQVSLRAQQRDDQVKMINDRVADHESRIRVLERPVGLAGPR